MTQHFSENQLFNFNKECFLETLIPFRHFIRVMSKQKDKKKVPYCDAREGSFAFLQNSTNCVKNLLHGENPKLGDRGPRDSGFL